MLLGFGIIGLVLTLGLGIGYTMPETIIVTETQVTEYTTMLQKYSRILSKNTNANPYIQAFHLIERSLPDDIYLNRLELDTFINTSLSVYEYLSVEDQIIYNKYMATALTFNDVLLASPSTQPEVEEIRNISLRYNNNLMEIHSRIEEFKNKPESPVLPILGIIASVTILTGVIIYKTYNK